MRPDGIVVTPPLLDHDLRFRAGSKPFKAKTFVPELAVKAFVRPVLPGLAGFAERHVHAVLCSPLQDSPRDELRTIVGAQVARRTMNADQLGQDFDHAPRANRSGHVNRQAFTRVLIDHRQTLQLLTAGTRIEYEVICPDVPCPRRRLWPRPMNRYATARAFAWHLQASKTPQP